MVIFLKAENSYFQPYNIFFHGKTINNSTLWSISKVGDKFNLRSVKFNKFAQEDSFMKNQFNLDFVRNSPNHLFTINCVVKKEKANDSIFPCKKITFQLYKKDFLFTNKNNFYIQSSKTKKQIYNIEILNKKYLLKDQNGKYLKPHKEKYYKNVLADGKKGDLDSLWEVEKKNGYFTFKGVTGYMKYCLGCIYGGSAVANVHKPDYFSFWNVKCVD